MNFASKEKQPLIWRAWANVAWDSVRVVGLCFKFTTVKLQGPNKSSLNLIYTYPKKSNSKILNKEGSLLTKTWVHFPKLANPPPTDLGAVQQWQQNYMKSGTGQYQNLASNFQGQNILKVHSAKYIFCQVLFIDDITQIGGVGNFVTLIPS